MAQFQGVFFISVIYAGKAYQSVLFPGNIGALVGVGVGEPLDRTGLTAKETVKVGANLVGTAGLDSVTLSATGL